MFSSPSSSSSFPFTLTVSSSSSPAMVEFQSSDENQPHGFLGLLKKDMQQQAPPPPTLSTCDDLMKPLSGSQNEANDKQDEKNMKKVGKITVRKHKYAFQTRSQVDILDDGYRWRKYGQKAVKNNRFPRSYYRCTHQGCHVKKQVQRLSRDEGIVVTTYEGIHSHPIERSTDNFEHILSQMQIYSTSL